MRMETKSGDCYSYPPEWLICQRVGNARLDEHTVQQRCPCSEPGSQLRNWLCSPKPEEAKSHGHWPETSNLQGTLPYKHQPGKFPGPPSSLQPRSSPAFPVRTMKPGREEQGPMHVPPEGQPQADSRAWTAGRSADGHISLMYCLNQDRVEPHSAQVVLIRIQMAFKK